VSQGPKLSIVIPMLNEESSVAPLFARLFPVLEGLGEPFEVIVVDDGSRDATPALLERDGAKHPQLIVLTLARNCGQHAAIMAGFETARGEWVVTLDADLQNPPEEIPRLVSAFREGYDLVNTVRQEREDSWLRRTASRWINAAARRASGIELHDFGCMLRGYHRDLLALMTQRKEFDTFIPALAMLYARCPIEIPVAHAARRRGASKYSLLKLFSLQLDLMTGFSLSPIRVLFSVGTLIAGFGISFSVVLLSLRLLFGAEWAAEGVFTLFAILFFFIGAQFVAFGLIGEYVGRIYYEVRDRPAYIIRRRGPPYPHSRRYEQVVAPQLESIPQDQVAAGRR
jgi:undecaprenyl-phosphate 4-deoxy-4-formamido-L-arabinose transferase